MKPILKLKIAVDAAMSLLLLLLMAYGLVGEAAHEWLGMGIFAMFILHHYLNRAWLRNLGKGRYSPMRIVQTLLAALIFLCMLFSMISGILLSRYLFVFLPKHGGYDLCVKLHILGAYWGLVLMSVHLGLHWSMMLSILGKRLKPSRLRATFFHAAGILIAFDGVQAFVRRSFGTYLLLQSHFVFFDYSEPTTLFLLDHLAVMGLFVWVGYWLAAFLKRTK